MKLTRYEQETVITFNAEEQHMHIYTADPVMIRKMDKLVEINTDYSLVKVDEDDDDVFAKTYTAPKKFLRWRGKAIEMSEEQKNAVKERFAKNRAGKKA